MLASVGFPQVLHSCGFVHPELGTSMKDLLEGLGVVTNLSKKSWEMLFYRHHIGFLWTESLNPSFAKLRPLREQLGLGTVLDSIEKMMNPLNSDHMIIGVKHSGMMERMIPSLMRLGYPQVYLVQGIEGSEDLPIHTTSCIRIVTPWGDETRLVEPHKLGFYSKPLEPLSKAQQILLLQRVMAGDDSPELKRERDHIIFNAGLRLTWFDKVGSYEEGFHMAATLLERKAAFKVLTKWQEQSAQMLEQETHPKVKKSK
ncbi:Anthranilate phosphoribosyltransferase [compost metagenome]